MMWKTFLQNVRAILFKKPLNWYELSDEQKVYYRALRRLKKGKKGKQV